MKKLVAILLCSLMATSAFALLDEDPDMLGIYFDTAGDVVCAPGTFNSIQTAYVLYTKPSIPSTRGFECGISMARIDGTEILPIWFPPTFPVPATNIGNGGYIIVGYSTPVATSTATLMATISWFNLEMGEVDIFLGPSVPSSNDQGLPMVMAEDYSLLVVGPSSNLTHVAQLNVVECRVVDNEDASFGAVKALFR
jgi:hypothetical protein